ncbi:cytidine deaminase [Nisaea acidiphila]|uniref:Cytidine deaminase n=1 Tax=Nisaea acidiphila TaxID=1862145 RepID=A0A9J7AU21_9PROT|nr:cytidine deaminase [Nisaea acidiphila]UUX50856.1 cytidine deaminase [Nisaea acidiphila]
MAEIEIVLPAVEAADRDLKTETGTFRLAGLHIPEKRVKADPAVLRDLVKAARHAARGAHAPYSNFHVGAAVIMADDPEGRVITGANVENASYGAAVCGERNALHAAAAKGFRKIRFLALSTADSLDGPLQDRSPCGICRQVMREFIDRDESGGAALILVDTGDPDFTADILDIDRLLPYGFRL